MSTLSSHQRYPEDHDGILAGSPAIDYNHLNAYQIHVNSLQANKSSPGYIPTSLYPSIHSAVLKACDELDRVKDGVVSDPRVCKPRFDDLLLCGSPGRNERSGCLTWDQIRNLHQIYKTYRIEGKLIHEPVLPGSEFGWTVNDGVVGKPFPAAPGWYE